MSTEQLDLAGTRRRAPRRALGLTAAAVLVAVGVPTALLLRPDDGAPSPVGPSPSAAPSAGLRSLQAIPLGPPPGITYLQDGTVHLAQGGTVPLPVGTDPVNDFTSYHGGWLVAIGAGGPEHVSWYDGAGTRRTDGPGVGVFAVSEDGTRTAYPQSGAIHVGITSGMSDGERRVPGSAHTSWPIGFLRGDVLVHQAGDTVVVDGGGDLPVLIRARAVSAADALVSGEDRTGHTAVLARNGRVAWRSSEWVVWGFSPDGRYAAATDELRGGPTAVAILDARTGRVVAQHALPAEGIGIGIGDHAVMDVDGTLLVPATDGNTLEQTVLRLARDGTLTRATPIFPVDTSSDSDYVVFATRP